MKNKSLIAQPFQEICRYIETHADELLTLEKLSTLADMSPSYFQRRFKAIVGVSPQQYQEGLRLKQFKKTLKTETTITDALYEAGFSSSSRIYERLDSQLGMTPKQYRKGGKGLHISYAITETRVGILMLAATDRGLCFIQFNMPKEELISGLKKEYPNAILLPMTDTLKPEFDNWIEALNQHLAGNNPHLELPLDIQGTAFQQKVWRYLQQIPYGEVQSYKQVAEGMGSPKAIRAVANACASNNLAIAIPCHRVIRGDGTLGGFRWGLSVKQAMLEQEKLSLNH